MNTNQFLTKAQAYLMDLDITHKAKILSELSDELKNRDLQGLDVLTMVNQKRVEHGHAPHSLKGKSNIGSLLLKSFVVLTVVFVLFITFLITKFTPVFKVDEKNQRVIILGGLIDIDGKAGKFKVGDDIQFADSNYSNEFYSSTTLTDKQKSIEFIFESGKHTYKSSSDNQLVIDCKLSMAPQANFFKNTADKISLNFEELSGSCELSIPKDKMITVQAQSAQLTFKQPEFDIQVMMDNGLIQIEENKNVLYGYNLSVIEGVIDQFPDNKAQHDYMIEAKLENGTIELLNP